jgi:hypothetical protein
VVEWPEGECHVHTGPAQPEGEGHVVGHDLDAAVARLQLEPDALGERLAIGRVGHEDSLPQSAA